MILAAAGDPQAERPLINGVAENAGYCSDGPFGLVGFGRLPPIVAPWPRNRGNPCVQLFGKPSVTDGQPGKGFKKPENCLPFQLAVGIGVIFGNGSQDFAPVTLADSYFLPSLESGNPPALLIQEHAVKAVRNSAAGEKARRGHVLLAAQNAPRMLVQESVVGEVLLEKEDGPILFLAEIKPSFESENAMNAGLLERPNVMGGLHRSSTA